eukprot:g67261.t1
MVTPGEEVEMEVSEDEEEEQEQQEQEQKEDEKEQKVEEENDDDEEGGDDEGPPVYNPSPYTPLQVADEKAKLTSKGFDWVLGPQTVDPSSDRPRHKASCFALWESATSGHTIIVVSPCGSLPPRGIALTLTLTNSGPRSHGRLHRTAQCARRSRPIWEHAACSSRHMRPRWAA